MADLDKKTTSGRDAEQIVSEIASKTPELKSVPNQHHTNLLLANLLGYKIDIFDYRPHIAGGIPTISGGKKGYKFEISPEAKAFNRWQGKQFMELEKDFAKDWRESIKNMSFEFSAKYIQSLGIDISECKNINDAYEASNKLVTSRNQPQLFASLLVTLAIPQVHHNIIIQRYISQNGPSLMDFAPYAAHITKIDVFFYISVARGFISGERPSNKIDMSYLYYLPFCNVFISGDKLHRKTAGLFMTKNQKFIWAPDLKADLKKLNQYYDRLPQEQKELGLFAIASNPPTDEKFLTTNLWDEYLPAWRKNIEKEKPSTNKISIDELKKHAEAQQADVEGFDEESIEHMTLKRSVSKTKGSWYQLPKDLKH